MKESTFNKFLFDALEFIELAKALSYDYEFLKMELDGSYKFNALQQFSLNTPLCLKGKHPKDQAVEDAYNRLVDTYISEFDIQAKKELNGQTSLFEKGSEE